MKEDKEKASLFAEYFSSVFTHEKEEEFEELKLSYHINNMPSIKITVSFKAQNSPFPQIFSTIVC